jgi:hypothetical protein
MGLFNFKKEEKKDEFGISPILPKEIYQSAVLDLKDVLAPSALDIKSKYIDLGEKLSRTFFIISYPKYLSDG